MSEQGYNPGVEAGQSARQSAPVMNKITSYIDEVANGVPRGIRLTPQSKSVQETGRLVSLAEATEDIDHGDWLNIVGVNIDSDANEEYFNYGDCLPKVDKLAPDTKDSTIAVALEPIKSGDYGRICLAGACVANVEIPDGSTYKYYDIKEFTAAGAVKGTDIDTGRRILWHDTSAGTELAYVALNLGGGADGTFVPIDLTQVGGAQGTNLVEASWTYDVFRADERGTGPTAILTDIDPVSGTHKFRRPNLGQMAKATHGYAYMNVDGDYEICWINEALIVAECEEE